MAEVKLFEWLEAEQYVRKHYDLLMPHVDCVRWPESNPPDSKYCIVNKKSRKLLMEDGSWADFVQYKALTGEEMPYVIPL